MRPRVFISHASEDKDEIARPLAHSLKDRGFEVWYDEFSLKAGDLLLRSIDRGLLECDYGIVILSPAFFAKKWPQSELSGLVAREKGNETIVLPIWHKLTEAEVVSYSPMLAERLAVSTSGGFREVIERIISALRARGESRLRDLSEEDFLILYSISGTEMYDLMKMSISPATASGFQMYLYSDASGLDSNHSYVEFEEGARRIIRSKDIKAVVLATWYIRSQKTTSFSDGCTK